MHDLPVDFAPYARASRAAYNVAMFRSADTDTEVALHVDTAIDNDGYEGEPIGIAAFRGTETQDLASLWEDFKTDLDGGLVQMRPRVDVREGFWKAYASVRNRVLQLLKGNLDNTGRAHVTGHSLGGALAAIAANDAAVQSWCRGVVCVTFGQPRVFGSLSTMHHKVHYLRVVNNNDIVPALPPVVTPLARYRHSGQRMYLDTEGNCHQNIGGFSEWVDRVEGAVEHIGTPGLDCISDHSIDAYVRICEGLTV